MLDAYPSPIFEFTHCDFSQNGSQGYYAYPNPSASMTDCTISNNGANGVFAISGRLELKRVLISGNTADYYDASGGGAMLVFCNAEFNEVLFVDNAASSRGGGIFIGGAGTYLLADCAFSGCSAPIGAQAFLGHMEGTQMEIRFNCCDIDTTQFAGSAWEDGIVEITYDGCAVPLENRSWSDVKDLYR